MAPTAAAALTLLSPAELSYLHTSLSLAPPIRADARTPTQFRPLTAETDFLPGANGSARVCYADGTEAIVGVKADVEKSSGVRRDNGEEGLVEEEGGEGDDAWVEMTVDIPGFRDDDPLPIFMAAMLNEALLASGDLPRRLRINSRFHWKLYIDALTINEVLLLSPPLSYPLPLLSLTTHLALLSARLPRLKSELEEDPLFDDDWDASGHLYPRDDTQSKLQRPPVTLLVMSVGSNIIFDPSREELAVADAALAVSMCEKKRPASTEAGGRELILLSTRAIDPPSRVTTPGVPNVMNPATGGTAPVSTQAAIAQRETLRGEEVWTPPRGGISRKMLGAIIRQVLHPGGPAEEVLAGLEAVEV
ncbi:MAG: hypothetical protein M1833_004169 [Piccolia ochrophora]|nr:MAG: hypothetical protein M1833_004169 [Piccolia ochrophora]